MSSFPDKTQLNLDHRNAVLLARGQGSAYSGSATSAIAHHVYDPGLAPGNSVRPGLGASPALSPAIGSLPGTGPRVDTVRFVLSDQALFLVDRLSWNPLGTS